MRNNKNQPVEFDIHRTLRSRSKLGSESLENTRRPHKKKIFKKSYEDYTSTKPRRFGLKKKLAMLLLILLIPILVIGVWDWRNFSAASQKIFGSSNLFSFLSLSGLETDENGRVNVLIVGYSIDDPGHPAATLTDSILLLSMNKDKKTGYMLSIPRDLYVDLGGGSYAKINEAFQTGNAESFAAEGFPPGGIGLLEKIVSENFDVKIGYYALINYGAVRGTVDALGGITVNINSPDERGLLDTNISPVDGGPLNLPNGPQKLDGQTALNLTRARGDAFGSYGFPRADFDRTEHQRQVFSAIKDKISWKIVLNPKKNGKLFNTLADNVKTDIKQSEIRPLFSLFNSISSDKLQPVALNPGEGVNLLQSYATFSGQSALVPAAGIDDYSQIQAALDILNKN